jgi:hypothetical protein
MRFPLKEDEAFGLAINYAGRVEIVHDEAASEACSYEYKRYGK